MIRRFRVAVKYVSPFRAVNHAFLPAPLLLARFSCRHSSPIYAENWLGLMPSLLGVPSNRYRLFVLLLCLFFVYTWRGQNQSHAEQLRLRDARITQLQQKADSVSEKLRIIWLHKNKLETSLNAQKTEADKFLSKIKLKESEVNGWKTKNEQCLAKLSTCQKERELPKQKGQESNREEEVSELKRRIEELEDTHKKKEMENDAVTGILKDELKQCETKIKLLTGGGAVEHYSQNDTAHFNRNHKADDPLSFDRGNIQHHIPNKLLLGRQLAETLEEAKRRKLQEKEQLDKHPQDRDVKDQEVNEQPDGEEHDYKEH